MSSDHPALLNQFKARPPDAKPLMRDEAFTLIKLYDDKGWAVKQQMLTSVGWLTPIVAGLIAYYFTDSPNTKAAIWTAFALSFFMLFITVISLIHANEDYRRSHDVIKHVKAKNLVPGKIVSIILGNKERLERLSAEKDAKLPLKWRDQLQLIWLTRCPYFRYIGWQFISIMAFAVALSMGSLALALWTRVADATLQ